MQECIVAEQQSQHKGSVANTKAPTTMLDISEIIAGASAQSQELTDSYNKKIGTCKIAVNDVIVDRSFQL